MAGHRYSTDDVVTAWAAGQELRRLLLPALGHKGVDGSGLRGLDLGTGLGSVLLMMAWQFPSLRYVGIEAQGRNAERARRSCWVNGCEGRAEIKHGDIRALFDAGAGLSPVPEGERGFDIVTGASFCLGVLGGGRTDGDGRLCRLLTIQCTSPCYLFLVAGTPPYFDAHGAPAPSSAADPPIDITALPQGNEGDGAAVAVARKAASGRARTQPVPLPAAEDQRPCNFELRGGCVLSVLAFGLSWGGMDKRCMLAIIDSLAASNFHPRRAAGWRCTAAPPRPRWRPRGSLSCARRTCRAWRRAWRGRPTTQVNLRMCLIIMYCTDTQSPPPLTFSFHRTRKKYPGLTLLRKLAVRPKRHQPPLFAVYTFCHAGGEAAAAYRGALRTAGEFPFLVLVDSRPPLSAVGGDDEDAPQLVLVGNGPNMVKETLSVREAGKGGSGGRVPRTDEYRRVMEDMCMPDNDLPCEA